MIAVWGLLIGLPLLAFGGALVFFPETARRFSMWYRTSKVVAAVLTTCVSDPQRNERVKTRNAVVQKIAEELNCPILDFYSPSLNCTHTDGVHFNGDGYRTLAETLISDVRILLK